MPAFVSTLVTAGGAAVRELHSFAIFGLAPYIPVWVAALLAMLAFLVASAFAFVAKRRTLAGVRILVSCFAFVGIVFSLLTGALWLGAPAPPLGDPRGGGLHAGQPVFLRSEGGNPVAVQAHEALGRALRAAGVRTVQSEDDAAIVIELSHAPMERQAVVIGSANVTSATLSLSAIGWTPQGETLLAAQALGNGSHGDAAIASRRAVEEAVARLVEKIVRPESPGR